MHSADNICFTNSLRSLTVRLLETRTSTASSVFLGFTSTRITDKKVTVIVQQSLSQLVLATLVNILGVVSNDSLGNCCTDSIDLCSTSSSLNAYTDIEVGELLLSEDKDGLEGLQAKRFGLDKLNGLTVDLNKTTSLLGESTCSGGLFPGGGKKKGRSIRYFPTLIFVIAHFIVNCVCLSWL